MDSITRTVLGQMLGSATVFITTAVLWALFSPEQGVGWLLTVVYSALVLAVSLLLVKPIAWLQRRRQARADAKWASLQEKQRKRREVMHAALAAGPVNRQKAIS